jgi:hypothetical protein
VFVRPRRDRTYPESDFLRIESKPITFSPRGMAEYWMQYKQAMRDLDRMEVQINELERREYELGWLSSVERVELEFLLRKHKRQNQLYQRWRSMRGFYPYEGRK